MGCDIHFKIERRIKDIKKPITYYNYNEETKSAIPQYADDENWHCVDYNVDAEYGDRNYYMFAHLAGVRAWDNEENYPEPKGLPEDISDYTKRSCCLLYNTELSDEQVEHDWNNRLITKSDYEKWSKLYPNLVCKYTQELKHENKRYKLMYDIDYHSHSWVTREEFEEIINKAYLRDIDGEKKFIGNYSYYLTLLETLRAHEVNGLYETRLVFWFDN